jgi:hypothetical protein
MSDLNKFLNRFSGLTAEVKHNLYAPTPKFVAPEPIVEKRIIEMQPEPVIQIEEEHESEIELNLDEIVSDLVETTLKLDLTEGSQYDKLFKTNVDLFNQPNLPKVAPEVKALTDRLKYLEDWVTKISMAGPGGGEVNLRWLDDIDRSSIANDRYLKYDQHTNKFVFENPNGSQIGTLDYIQLNTSGPTENPLPGTLSWNPQEDCLDVTQNDGSTLQVGLENYIQVHNHTGSLLTNGSVVKFSGVDPTIPDLPLCSPMTADYTAEPLYIIGILTNDIADGESGRATILGRVHNINTTGSDVGESWSVGDILWVHPTLPGKLTKVKPTLPQIAISVAAVVKSGSTTGTLLVRPVIWPRLNYGVFSNTVDHNPLNPNTAYPISLDTTNIASGFTLAANSHIVATQSGLYNFNMSAQLSSTNSSAKNVYFWVKKNNNDIPYSTRSQSITGNNTRITFSCNWTISMNANDYVELMWAVDDITIRLDAIANTAFCPSTPSVLLTVTQGAL